jgi:hypothetical protein
MKHAVTMWAISREPQDKNGSSQGSTLNRIDEIKISKGSFRTYRFPRNHSRGESQPMCLDEGLSTEYRIWSLSWVMISGRQLSSNQRPAIVLDRIESRSQS